MFTVMGEINSNEWKGMKENRECTSGDYYITLTPLFFGVALVFKF